MAERIWVVDDQAEYGMLIPTDIEGKFIDDVIELDPNTATAKRFKRDINGGYVFENNDLVIETVKARGWTLTQKNTGKVLCRIP